MRAALDPVPTDIPICPTCGVIALPSRLSCDRCQSPYTRTLLPKRADKGYFARVEWRISCGACGADVPRNHVDVAEPIFCPACGHEESVPLGLFKQALDFAQGLSDVAGCGALYVATNDAPDGTSAASARGGLPPKGAEPPNACREIGVTRSHLEQTFEASSQGPRPIVLRVDVSPGHPLCPKCNAPIELGVNLAHAPAQLVQKREVSATARCSGCNERAIYTVPARAHALCPSLSAVIATEHRTNRLPVEIDAGAAQCPSCHEALAIAVDLPFVTCEACNTVARVPERLRLQRARGAGASARPAPEIMWLLFRGPSALRNALAERARLVKEKEDSALAAAALQDRTRQTNIERARQESRRARARGLAALVLLIGIVGVLAWAIPRFFPYQKGARADACRAGAWKLCDEQAQAQESADPVTALRLYDGACRAGYAPSCAKSGHLQEARGDVTAASSAYARGCDAGDMPGCSRLGSLFERGPFGVARDFGRAATLYEQACDGGDPLGCLNLASMTEAGRGVARSEAQAVVLLEKACEAKEKAACFSLAERYRAGRGVRRDEAKAAALAKTACSLGHGEACVLTAAPH